MTIFPPENSCRLWDNVEKYNTARQATDDNTAHAHYMLDNWGYRHTLRICNAHCFSTTTMVERTPFKCYVILHCISLFRIAPPPKKKLRRFSWSSKTFNSSMWRSLISNFTKFGQQKWKVQTEVKHGFHCADLHEIFAQYHFFSQPLLMIF